VSSGAVAGKPSDSRSATGESALLHFFKKVNAYLLCNHSMQDMQAASYNA